MSISVIIPVHNSEKYLEDCLMALIYSIPDDSEIIIVDDGSTDRSSEIYSKFIFLHCDKDIKVVYQECQGVSSARNKGISFTSKEYICFLDSDDICKPDMHKYLLKTALDGDDRADFCYCGVNCYNQDMSEIIRSFDPSRYIGGLGSDVALAFLKDKTYISISSYIVKKDLLEKNNIRFTVGCSYGEDDEFTLKCLLYSRNVRTVSQAYFCYRISPYSATASVSFKRFDNPFASVRLCEYVKQCFPENKDFIQALNHVYIPTCLLNVIYLFAQSGKEYQPVLKYMKENGLTTYLENAHGTRPTISLMMFLWHLHPKLLYYLIFLKHAISHKFKRWLVSCSQNQNS